MATQSLLGYDNIATRPDTTLTASSAEPLMPVTNLRNDQGDSGDGWQTLAGTAASVLLTIDPALPAQTWRAIGVFRTNLTSAATAVVTLFNAPSTVVYVSPTLPGPIGNGQIVHVLPADTVADYATIAIADAGNPDTFVNIPLAFAGPVWLPQSGFSYSTVYARDSLSATLVSKGGQKYPHLYAQQRRWDVDMTGVRTSTELWPTLDAMNKTARTGTNILMIPDILSANIQYEATFGDLSQTADVSFGFGFADRRSWRGRIVERV